MFQKKGFTIYKFVLKRPIPDVEPTKLYFFDNEEFFRFSLGKLAFLLHTEKNIDSKMT